ncbi:MAG TPA: translocation/assembly module TamB domain-containing protein [Candidatus Acidoferrales bacterium]|nr:translocation/assembly module TamB domain-containing protein [Candidatus Acidoferrales bacterium]
MRRWTIRIFWGLLLLVIAIAVFLAVILNTGTADRWARNYIVKKIATSTGARVELRGFQFSLSGLSADLDDFTLHGRETPAQPPFFHADHIHVSAHIISLLRHKVSLADVQVAQPSIFITVDKNGQSNLPVPPPKNKKSTPFKQQLFNLEIANLKISNGVLIFNDQKIPLDVEGGKFQFAMNYQAAPNEKDSYAGQFSWNQVRMKARKYRQFPFDFATKFTMTRTGVSVDDLTLALPHTTIEARADVRNFSPVDADFHVRGQLALPDIRTIMRKPSTPDGTVEFTANGTYAQKQLQLNGHYHARGLVLKFKWFHAGGIESWGDLYADKGHLHMPIFYAKALGGNLQGRLDLAFKGLQFRTDTKFIGANLAEVLEAVNNSSMPVHALHWGGALATDTVCTWQRDFKHFAVKGTTFWTPPPTPEPGIIGVTANMKFHYVMDRHAVDLSSSTINTANSQVTFNGTLSGRDSALGVAFHTARIADWSDFIAVIRGPHSSREEITGSADWKGNLTGRVDAPTFTGIFDATDAHFGRLYWDSISGSMVYSPVRFALANAAVKRGNSTANLELMLQLDNWNFRKENQWTLHAHLVRASLSDLQGLMGTSYPATAVLTADFQGSGTREDPILDGNFVLENMDAYGVHADRASAVLNLRHDEIRLTDAKIDRDTGHVTGNLLYHPEERTVEFQTIGTGISLAKFGFLETKPLPIGGDIDFDLRGSGPVAAPVAHGTVQLIDLKFGGEVLDSFSGTLDSDGRAAQLVLHSHSAGKLDAQAQVQLAGNYPLTATLGMKQVDLDPFISAGLHLSQLTGHSSIDGQLSLSGEAAEPQTITVQANLSRVAFNYEYVKLQNEGPVRLTYSKSEVRVEQATLSGSNTNFQISGDARFTGNRELNLKVGGSVNLRLVTGLFPSLDARGVAQLDATIGGTFSNPQVIGRAKIVGASAHYGDFPAGVSDLNGDLVFDRSRLLLENFAGSAGGGTLTISGNVGYGERPVRYEIDGVAKRVRVRYPEGVSWLLDGNVRFSGTTTSAVLSGNASVQRVTFAPNVDFSSMMLASSTTTTLTGPSISSAYLRNLQFDIAANAVPGMRVDWGTAHFSAEGGVRVRGTWEHPIVLGNIHLLTGEMAFHGNTYRLNRGDINFSNPFRFDPVLNIEVATTVNPYEITLDFSGPASHIQLAYRSDPPLPASDIVNLLALGTQGEESALISSTSNQAQNFAATTLLSEAVTSQIGAPIERLFGVTNFRIDPFLASTLANTGVTQTTEARVTIQKQITHDLSVTYSTNAASNQQQVIEVDYAIHRNITIVALRDINGIYGVSVKFTKHFQ